MEKEILEVLGREPELSIVEIANLMGNSRATVSKYLYIMEAKGVLACRRRGPLKLWTALKRQ